MSKFNQIIGYESIKEELKWYCDILKSPERYKRLGVKAPKGLLLYGDPGVGKSLMANCLIEESGCNAYTIRKNLPNGDFVKEIKRIFEEASASAPSIVFLDDIDKFANCDYTHTDAEEYVTIQACMDEYRDSGVFVVATANDVRFLPDSLRRKGRFGVQFQIENPRVAEAEKIIAYYIKDKRVVDKLDCSEIASLLEGCSCATLESVINEAGIIAGYQKKKTIQREDIVHACVRYLFGSPLPKDVVIDNVARRVALHEAGHTVVAEILRRGSVSAVCIGMESGQISGFTNVKKGDDFYFFKENLENDIICSLGGKAAVDVIEGSQDVGCVRDLHDANHQVRNFIDDLCMRGFDTFDYGDVSNDTKALSDQKVAVETERYYQEARRIIAENRLFVGAVMAALLEKRILTQKEIAAIRKEFEKIINEGKN